MGECDTANLFRGAMRYMRRENFRCKNSKDSVLSAQDESLVQSVIFLMSQKIEPITVTVKKRK